MENWNEEKVLSVIAEAREAGFIAAVNKLRVLQGEGPKYSVMDGQREVGQLLDVCGFANMKIPAKGKFYQLAKRMSKNHAYRFHCDHAYNGGGWLSIYDSTMRQEMSVNVAACSAQAEVLKKYGVEARVESRID